MTVQLLFGTSVAFGFIAWAVVTNLYIWPRLRTRSHIDALRPHSWRYARSELRVLDIVIGQWQTRITSTARTAFTKT